MTTSAESKAAALEGLDFIETEEDVKAVEAATLKIQSTFRGKKFRSKLTPSKAGDEPATASAPSESQGAVRVQDRASKSCGQQTDSTTTSASTKPPTTTTPTSSKSSAATAKHRVPDASSTSATKTSPSDEAELSKRTARMQVNDNEGQPQNQSGLPEDEAERAATKIQAGFKGYKTRKELESKLPAGLGGAQQAAPDGCQTDSK